MTAVSEGASESERAKLAEAYQLRSLEIGGDLPHYNEWLLSPFRKHLHGRVIEVGAGLGTIAARYIDDVDAAVLVEPAESLHAELAALFASRSNIRTSCGLLEDVIGKDLDGIAVTSGSFDAACLFNVLEHIEDDVRELRRLYDLLRPGGALLVFVPANPFLYGSLDVRAAHFRRYTKAGLVSVIEEAGFSIESLRFFDMLGMIPWFITGRVLKQQTVSHGGARFYDSVIVPVCQRLDTITGPRIGKNLVCVARKPRS